LAIDIEGLPGPSQENEKSGLAGSFLQLIIKFDQLLVYKVKKDRRAEPHDKDGCEKQYHYQTEYAGEEHSQMSHRADIMEYLPEKRKPALLRLLFNRA
jgi:hypothetical protein